MVGLLEGIPFILPEYHLLIKKSNITDNGKTFIKSSAMFTWNMYIYIYVDINILHVNPPFGSGSSHLATFQDTGWFTVSISHSYPNSYSIHFPHFCLWTQIKPLGIDLFRLNISKSYYTMRYRNKNGNTSMCVEFSDDFPMVAVETLRRWQVHQAPRWCRSHCQCRRGCLGSRHQPRGKAMEFSMGMFH